MVPSSREFATLGPGGILVPYVVPGPFERVIGPCWLRFFVSSYLDQEHMISGVQRLRWLSPGTALFPLFWRQLTGENSSVFSSFYLKDGAIQTGEFASLGPCVAAGHIG